MKRYDKYGKRSINGKYDQYGRLLVKDNIFKIIKSKIHTYRQNKMIVPTDPVFIKKRADEIRQEIKEQREKRIELAELNKDIELIKFHARMKGKIKLDNFDYEDQRDKQDTKEFLDD